jgi:diguanylate cyclase (GGDEF)-like protein
MPIFKRRINNELSSQIIYRYVKNGNAAIYLDLFRTVVNYNNEQTGLAIFTDVTDIVLKEQLLMLENETFKELSEVDVLTGIYNRRAFDNKLAEFLDIASRYGRHLSLIMFDIDKFKEINDTYGHEAGDSVLRELSKTVKTGLRKTDFFARYGGEEFMIISPETDISTAKELAERLREQIEIHDFKIEKNITCSFGVTEFNRNNKNDYQSIVSRADTALYEAKRNGRNKVCVK